MAIFPADHGPCLGGACPCDHGEEWECGWCGVAIYRKGLCCTCEDLWYVDDEAIEKRRARARARKSIDYDADALLGVLAHGRAWDGSARGLRKRIARAAKADTIDRLRGEHAFAIMRAARFRPKLPEPREVAA